MKKKGTKALTLDFWNSKTEYLNKQFLDGTKKILEFKKYDRNTGEFLTSYWICVCHPATIEERDYFLDDDERSLIHGVVVGKMQEYKKKDVIFLDLDEYPCLWDLSMNQGGDFHALLTYMNANGFLTMKQYISLFPYLTLEESTFPIEQTGQISTLRRHYRAGACIDCLIKVKNPHDSTLLIDPLSKKILCIIPTYVAHTSRSEDTTLIAIRTSVIYESGSIIYVKHCDIEEFSDQDLFLLHNPSYVFDSALGEVYEHPYKEFSDHIKIDWVPFFTLSPWICPVCKNRLEKKELRIAKGRKYQHYHSDCFIRAKQLFPVYL